MAARSGRPRDIFYQASLFSYGNIIASTLYQANILFVLAKSLLLDGYVAYSDAMTLCAANVDLIVRDCKARSSARRLESCPGVPRAPRARGNSSMPPLFRQGSVPELSSLP